MTSVNQKLSMQNLTSNAYRNTADLRPTEQKGLTSQKPQSAQGPLLQRDIFERKANPMAKLLIGNKPNGRTNQEDMRRLDAYRKAAGQLTNKKSPSEIAQDKVKDKLVDKAVKKGLGKVSSKALGGAFDILKSHFEATYKAIQQLGLRDGVKQIWKVANKANEMLQSKDPKVREQGRKILQGMVKRAKTDKTYRSALLVFLKELDQGLSGGGAGTKPKMRHLVLKGGAPMQKLYDMLRGDSILRTFFQPQAVQDKYKHIQR